jgi:hypothetical protein
VKKGDSVYYTTDTGFRYRARVLINHRDKTVTVSPQFVLDDDGDDLPGFLGDMKFRMLATDLRDKP